MKQNEFIQNPHLDGDDFFWQGNSTGFLLIHGFTATTAEVRLMAEKLHKDGFTTAAPLLPGHGTNPHDLNRSTWQMWLASVKKMYEKLLRDEYNRIFVIAESMGALLAIELAAQHPEIDGLLLFAPGLKARNLWLAPFLSPFIKYFEKSKRDDGLAWKGYNVYPVKAAMQLRKLQKHAQQQLPKITQPTLVFSAEYDKLITPDVAKIILKNITSDWKKHIHMQDSGHCILLDRELDQANQYILDFVEERDTLQEGLRL